MKRTANFCVFFIAFSMFFSPANSYASKFWGIITSLTNGIDDFAAYETEADTLCWQASQNCATFPGSPPSTAGWGLLDYSAAANPQINVVRDTDQIFVSGQDDCIQDWINARSAAATREATVVVGHARGSSIIVPGPHPFLYPRGNNFYALSHNGTIEDQDSLAQKFGAGFAALDSFVNRRWAGWRTTLTSDTTIDTEYYTAMFMKRLLIAENYYWSPANNINTNALYAIQTALDDIHDASPDEYTSVNALIASKDTLWLIHKKTSLPNPCHRVSYWAPTGGATRMASTWTRTAGDWDTLAYGATGRIAKLVPGQNPVLSDVIDNPPASFTHLNELRINPITSSADDQETAAISTDPVKSTFAVVWASNDKNVNLRWYNQMGLAEGNEFNVIYNEFGVRSPAITHSPNGDTVFVAWCEKTSGSSTFNQIKGSFLLWNPQQLTWTILSTSSATLTGYDMNYLSVAMRADGGYALVAQRYNPLNFSYGIWFSGVSPTTSTSLEIDGITENCFRPDIAAMHNGDVNYAVAYEYDGVANNGVNVITVLNNSFQLGVPTTIASTTTPPPSMCPSITYHSLDLFAVGYYNGSLMAKKILANANGTITVLQTITGETATSVSKTDVATRADGTIEICYDKSDGINGIEVFFAPQSGTSFLTTRRANRTTTGPQSKPAFAISQFYKCNSVANPTDPNYYGTISQNDVFAQRRLVIWQSDGQDGSGLGIVGRFYGINATTDTARWYDPDRLIGGAATGKHVSDDEGEDTGSGSALPTPDRGNLSLDENSISPSSFALYASYPNPFNPSTRIQFDVPVKSHVALRVFDLTGKEVAVLVDEIQLPGSYTVMFNGASLSSGTYFVQMKSSDFVKVQKLLLIK